MNVYEFVEWFQLEWILYIVFVPTIVLFILIALMIVYDVIENIIKRLKGN